MKAKPWLSLLLVLLYVLAAFQLNYFTARTEFEQIVLLFGILFLIYFFIIHQRVKLKWLLYGAVIVRICLLFSEPNLSDDIYRFIWDSRWNYKVF